MWKQTSSDSSKKIYTNSVTGSKCEQVKVYTDKDGNEWWGFSDLTSIPYTRTAAATKISSLYSLGLSKDDLNNHITKLKTVLKSDDREKYEKAYALVLDFENKASTATDAVKQISALVCVYYTLNDEEVDSFDSNLQVKKMGLLEADPMAHSFFLSRQIESTENYMKSLNLISQIASPM